MNIESISIAAIDVGERRREDLGDIAGLSQSIKTIGLLHPIVVDRQNGHYRLVAGARRLSAIERLGWNHIPAQLLESLSDDELREIELEENERRKALTDKERSRTFKKAKALLQDAEKAADVIWGQSPQVSQPKRGPKPKASSQRSVAKALGVDHKSLTQAQQQVETAEKFPFMKGIEWVEGHVRQARCLLKDIPEAEYPEINNYVANHKYIHPTTVIELLDKFAHHHDAETRQKIYRLIRSDDKRDQDLAKTTAAENPPRPNPVIQLLKDAAEPCRRIVKNYPKDPEVPALRKIISELEGLIKQCSKRSTDERVQ